jgi:FlaA1/EpsC-like NDP-sugar epimerase
VASRHGPGENAPLTSPPWIRAKAAIKIATDSVAWAVAITFTALVRFDFTVSSIDRTGLLIVIAVAAVTQTVAGSICGLYRRSRRTGSFDEVELLVFTAGLTTALVTFVNVEIGAPRFVPLSATVVGGFVALALMGGTRYVWRVHRERNLRPRHARERLVVFGAGEAGVSIISSLLRNPGSPYLPVALLDDDPAKARLRVMGIPVRGTREALPKVATEQRATALLIAMPSADSSLVRDLALRAAETGLMVKVLPRVEDLLDAEVGLGDIRELRDEDLLGRHQIETELEAIAGYLTGKRVLITGAGGSIGSELCRQISRFAPDRLMMLDHDESALHAVQLSLEGRALLDDPDLLLCDLRDRPVLERVFAENRPQVVFHAAALKHLPLLERHPGEALRTNVWGTLDLLEVAAVHSVERFVNVSTDKAADPTSALGYSKRLAERLTAYVAAYASGTFLSVRFGNVLGSRGSVLAAFRAQIEAGGPITVTDPDATRYFMTVSEACQLVIQAGAIGTAGQAHVLDMGQPVRIADVARRLAEQADRPIEIVYTGLRPGEKRHEALWGSDELDVRPVHPLISHVPVPSLFPAVVRALSPDEPPAALVARLKQLSTGAAMSDAEQTGAFGAQAGDSPARAAVSAQPGDGPGGPTAA